MIASLALAFLAGVLTILSPCVLPLVPLVMGAAVAEHRLAPLALAGGLALSFVAVGLFVATIGFAMGLDGEVFRRIAAVLMIAVGGVLAIPAAQERVALAAAPAGRWAGERLDRTSRAGVAGQFGVGLLLGAIWAPCVGPTLGAASLLAAQGRDLGAVAATMAVFGVGAALPLVLLGMLSREALARWRGRMTLAGRGARAALGIVLILAGLAVFAGVDKRAEAALVEASPAWLTELTTRY